MSFVPTYHKRNLSTIAELGDDTQKRVMKFYRYAVEQGVNILIYEGLRDEATQREYVAKGASQTMKSYHLVGQAIDFVPVVSGGKADWGAYGGAGIKKIVAYAKTSCGLTWGGDWKGFVDKPHLQNDSIAYGKDTFKNKPVPFVEPKPEVKPVASAVSHKVVAGDTLWGISRKYNITIQAIKSYNGLKSDVIHVGQVLALRQPKPAAKPNPVASSGIKSVGKIKIANLKSFTYIYSKPSDKSTKLGQAKLGAVYSIAGSVPDWYEIIYNGKRAYVKEKYANKA
ncbi:LysM peptidoglycan-binding domain-containing protein [Cytobacillus firmus]|nr:LysM peptidoglycan-binding domain-containing protein [Cytobacillus firmus]